LITNRVFTAVACYFGPNGDASGGVFVVDVTLSMLSMTDSSWLLMTKNTAVLSTTKLAKTATD
jgi:hypothetical protein